MIIIPLNFNNTIILHTLAIPLINCRWLKNLNEYGLCLLTDLPAKLGAIKEVILHYDWHVYIIL